MLRCDYPMDVMMLFVNLEVGVLIVLMLFFSLYCFFLFISSHPITTNISGSCFPVCIFCSYFTLKPMNIAEVIFLPAGCPSCHRPTELKLKSTEGTFTVLAILMTFINVYSKVIYLQKFVPSQSWV